MFSHLKIPCNFTRTDQRPVVGNTEKPQKLKEERKQETSVITGSFSYLNVAPWILSPCVIVSAAPHQSKTYQTTPAMRTHPGNRRSWYVLRWWHWTSKGKGSWMKQPPSRNAAGSHSWNSPTCTHALNLLMYEYNS